ncbi:MAG: hypothetical protein JNK82_07920 [Myxococcaceae bacterium]|nr:hypothetical protein [Myxococcaceae bacterium]
MATVASAWAGQSGSTPEELLATLERDVIPRLVLVHRRPGEDPCGDSRYPPVEQAGRELAELALQDDHPQMLALLERLCSAGMPVDTVLLEVIPKAARLIGDDWKADRRSFVEVTYGLGALQTLISAFRSGRERADGRRGVVVLVPAPTEQHTFALYLCGQYLRRNGWAATVAPDLTEGELHQLLATERITALGISVTNPLLVRSLERMIAGARRHSANPDLLIIVGGPPPELREIAERHGAVCAGDAVECLNLLEQRATRG